MKHIKKLSLIAVVTILALSTIMLCACNFGNNSDGSTPTPKTYTIQYTDDAGLHSITVESGALYSLDSIPQRTGYEFLGLYDAKSGGTQYVDEDGNCISAFKDNRNIVLYPQYKAKAYTLVLNYGEAAVTGMRQMTVSYGQTIAELPMGLQVENKTFTGWYTEENKGGVQVADAYGIIPDKAKVTESIFDLSNKDGYIYLYAGFKGQEYLVTFYYGDDPTPEEIMIEYGTYITDVVTTRRIDGKAVITWSKSKGSNAQNDIFTGKVTGSMVLYAYEYAPVIDFDANGGKAVTSIVRKAGTAIDLPTPERKDYTFVGWYTQSGSKYSASSMPSNSVKLIAHWQAKLIFNTNGGTAVDDISEPVGTKITLPTTEKDGYMFAGWYTEQGQEYTAASMPEVSVKLIAKYYKTISKRYVILANSKTWSLGYYENGSPSMDACIGTIDLSDIFDAGVKNITLTAHFNVCGKKDSFGFSETSPSAETPGYVNVNWYFDEVASDAYNFWTITTKLTSISYVAVTETKQLTINSNKIWICPYRDSSKSKSFSISITDFWVEVEYPDMSRLY